MSPAERFIPRLPWSKRTGNGRWIAKCPSHRDRSPSLSISEKQDGTLLIKCHAECEPEAIVSAVGLGLSDLYPPLLKSDYRPPDREAHDARDMLVTLADEMVLAYIVMADLQRWLADESKGQPPGPGIRARFLKAAERVGAAASYATGRHVSVGEERRAILAAGLLTPAEEIDFEEFASA